jgi:assimilatory nitrate reductase catalytic subunit
MKIIVVDPRRTDTAGMADLHLPLLPGTDVMLFHAMLHIMLWEGWTDAAYIAAHTSGFDASRPWCATARPSAWRSLRHRQGRPVTAARWFAGMDGGGPRDPRSACTARA